MIEKHRWIDGCINELDKVEDDVSARLKWVGGVCCWCFLSLTVLADDVAKEPSSLQVAYYDEQGKLQKPANLDEWIFLGSSLGMGYSEKQFDAANPGFLQVVTMEPKAYQYFKQHRQFADGSMFVLYFYNTNNKQSINQSGFVQGSLANFEIHVLDRNRFRDGRAFFIFYEQESWAQMLPQGNDCVVCHQRDGAFDGTFAQFYPTLRQLLPDLPLEKNNPSGND